MTLYGIDVHPTFQAGLNIEQVAAEGFAWVAVKVSQGTTTYAGTDWLNRAERAGMIAVPYHYLDAGNEAAQAATCLSMAGGRPIMLDVEAGSGNAGNVRAFLAAADRIGLRVALLYLPHWFWEGDIGSPSLAGMPPLVASSYVSGTGYASALYPGDNASGWNGYGGNTVAVLQFTDKASVAGQHVDANAYRGTVDQLRAFLGATSAATPRRKALPDMIERPLVAGNNTGTIIAPVGTASAVVAQAWVSVRASGGATVNGVWFQRSADADGPAPGAGPAWTTTLKSAARGWHEVPSGTEYLEYNIDAHGPGAIAVELLGKA